MAVAFELSCPQVHFENLDPVRGGGGRDAEAAGCFREALAAPRYLEKTQHFQRRQSPRPRFIRLLHGFSARCGSGMDVLGGMKNDRKAS